jgi:hypothetical protein
VDSSEFIYSVPGGHAYWFGTVTFAPATPEPSPLVLLGTGLLGVLGLGLRKRGGLLSRRV